MMVPLNTIFFHNLKQPAVLSTFSRQYARWSHRRPLKVYTKDSESSTNEQKDYPTEIRKVKTPRSVIDDKQAKNLTNNLNQIKEYPTKVRTVKTPYPNLNINDEKQVKNLDNNLKQIKEYPTNVRTAKTSYSNLNINDEKQLKNNFKQMNITPISPTINSENIAPDIKNSDDEVNYSNVKRVKEEDGKFSFEKMKRNDRKLSALMMEVKFRRQRERYDTVLLEGTRLIRDALLAKCKPKTILFSRMSELKGVQDLLPKENVTLYQVPYNDLQLWSALTTSPGVMGIFETPDVSEINSDDNDLPVTIICDNIRDPGNLGAVIRCSAAVGCKKIILTKGCVELWDLKVLRSASGAHFRIAIEQKQTWDDIQNQILTESTIFLADNNLNTHPLVTSTTYHDNQFLDCPEITLIVGGETQGVSNEAYELVQKKSGKRLHIPLSNGIESLNIGTALAVILYEIRRQISPVTIGGTQQQEKIEQVSNLKS